MTTLTKNNVIISVSVLFGLILLIWLVGFFVHRERQDPKNSTPSEPFLTYRSTKIIYWFTLAMALAGSILMIIYSIDGGVPSNSAQ
tara:strand:- start:132 stop:389 length:258 start_codon:yes stop_codon:yes gene_type:complete